MDFSKKLYERYNKIKVKPIYGSNNEPKNHNKDCSNLTEEDIRNEIDNNIDMKYNDILYDLSIDLQNYCRKNAYPLNIDFIKFKNMMMDNSSSLSVEYENLKNKMNDELCLDYTELKQLESRIENNNN